jgi:hypothetical protein
VCVCAWRGRSRAGVHVDATRAWRLCPHVYPTHTQARAHTHTHTHACARAHQTHTHRRTHTQPRQGAATLRLPLPAYLSQLKAAGLGSLPGTAAEVLCDGVRAALCPDKLSSREWVDVVEAGAVSGVTAWAPAVASRQAWHAGATCVWADTTFTHCLRPLFAALCAARTHCSAWRGPAHDLHHHVWALGQPGLVGAPPADAEGPAGVRAHMRVRHTCARAHVHTRAADGGSWAAAPHGVPTLL